MLRAILVTALVASAAIIIGCADKAPSSGTGARILPTNPAGLSPEAVLEYEGRRYAPVAIRSEAPTDDFRQIGRGTVSVGSDQRDVDILADEDDNTDQRVYSVERTSQSGGGGEVLVLWVPVEDTGPAPTSAR